MHRFSDHSIIRRAALALCVFAQCNAAFCASSEASILSEGALFSAGDWKARLTKLETLPFVDSDYTRRFTFDAFENPKLGTLRDRHHLDGVISQGRDEFDKQVLLMDWVHRQFKKFGRPSASPRGALEILDGIEAGHTFFCAHYAKLLVSSAASLGWVDRELALRRHQGAAKGGSTEHSSTEIWSNQHRKWVMLDPTANMYLEKDGIPLNAYEIRQEWFYRGGTNLIFRVGKERKMYRKNDLPIRLEYFAGFGDLTVDPDELDKYGFTAYIPNTNLMDSGEDYARMFIVKDKLCEGTRWHERTAPQNPAVDPYFPIGQAALSLRSENGQIHIALKTLTPNFKTYEIRFSGQDWIPISNAANALKPDAEKGDFIWVLRPGGNRLEVRTVNQFGVRGPVSSAEIEVSI